MQVCFPVSVMLQLEQTMQAGGTGNKFSRLTSFWLFITEIRVTCGRSVYRAPHPLHDVCLCAAFPLSGCWDTGLKTGRN